MVCKSHFPQADVFITDISDEALLTEWRPFNNQIPFEAFPTDETKFDFIFLNDVFEHVSDPVFVLRQLAHKLNPGGSLFIDTPKQFWIYPLTKAFSNKIYTSVLTGTVSTAHLQIWTRKSFEIVARQSGLTVSKYSQWSEYTRPADIYMRNMGITNPVLKLIGNAFYNCAKVLATNTIVSVLSKQAP